MATTAVPFGAVAIPKGEARTFSSSMDVVIVRSHPRMIANTLRKALYEDLVRILRLLKTWTDTESTAHLLRHRLSNLKVIQARTKRWAPLEPIGSLAGNLFGLATTADVKTIRGKINKIISTLENQAEIANDNVIALNDTINTQRHLERSVTALTRRAMEIRTKIEATISTQNDLIKADVHLHASATAEALISELEFHALQAQLFDRQYLHLRDWAEAGHLTESLVSREMLTRTLLTMKSPLSTRFIYQHTKVHLLRVSGTHIAYHFTIPKVDDEVFLAWQIVTAPHVTHSGTVTITPELSDIAMAHASGDLIDATDCLYSEPLLCWSPIRRQKAPCAQAIISKDGNLLHRCLINPTPTTLPYLVRLGRTQIIVTTNGEALHERCLTGPPSSYQVKAGTYLLQPDARCTIESSLGWSFTHGSNTNTTEVIIEDYVLPPLNFSLALPEEPSTPPPMNWTALEDLTRYADHLPKLLELPRLSPLTSHDGHAAWTALAITALFAVLCAAILAERRWRLLRRVFSRCRPKKQEHSAVTDDETQRPLSPEPASLAEQTFTFSTMPKSVDIRKK